MTFAQPFRDYEILERVGGGAMGTVFKARHRRLGRVVALKVLKPSLSRDERYVERLRREARIVASLNHPHIVSGFDMGEEGGYHFFVMEFVDGPSLRTLLAEWGMFAEEHVRRIARQAALALDHAWQRGVIHRDIKPGNLIVDANGDLKLTDLGLAKGPTDASLTRDGATIGTPYYISPEQARDPAAADVRSDLYSLGATLYHMATGVPPFQGATLAEVLTDVLSEPPVAPQAINPALSEGMALVIRKLLAKDPARRYQTPRELLDDLDRLDRAEAPLADAAQLARAEGERPRPPLRGWLYAAVLLVAAGAAGLAVARARPAPSAAAAYLAALDREVAALPTPGARLRLLDARADVPPDAAAAVAERRTAAASALAAAVDAAAADFLAGGLPTLTAWLDDPAVWPAREQVLRERLHPAVLAATGCDLASAPFAVAPPRLGAAVAAIDARLAARDAGLLAAFDSFLAGPVAEAVADACARDDFRAADGALRDALGRFLAGGPRPAVGALAEATVTALRERAMAAQQASERDVLAPAEAAVAAGVRGEVAAAAERLEQALRGGAPPAAIADELARVRADMARRWPPAERFRPGRSPWHDVATRCADVAGAAALAGAAERAARLAARTDLAWRALGAVGSREAMALLGGEPPADAELAARWNQHRRAIAAAAAVEEALVAAVAAPGAAIDAVRRSDGVVVRLDLVGGDASRLGARRADGGTAPIALGGLRLGPLFAALPQLAAGVADRHLGQGVWLLVDDDLGELAARTPLLGRDDHAFLLDVAAPIVARVRVGEAPPVGRTDAFARLRERLVAARAGGDVDELERILAQCAGALPSGARTEAEDADFQAARTFVQAESRRRSTLRALAAAAPAGAAIDVRHDGERLTALVRIEPRALQVDAPAAWRLQDGALAVANVPAELAQRALRCATGFDAAAGALAATAEVVFPPASTEARVYLLSLRDVAVVLCLDQDDGVHAAVVRGDPERDVAEVRAAIGRALQGVFGPVAARVVPGASHQLTLQVTPNAARTSALVEVRCDGAVLLVGERRAIDPRRVPEFVLTPLQAITLRRVQIADAGG